MASLWKRPNSKFYTACIRSIDGRQKHVTTKFTAKTKAQRLASFLESKVRAGLCVNEAQALIDDLVATFQPDGLHPIYARRIVVELVKTFAEGNLAMESVEDFLTRWLGRKTSEVAPSTLRRYREAVGHLKVFLGHRAKSDISSITAREIAAWRDDLAARLSVATVNVLLKIIRIAFGDAVRARLITRNEAAEVSTLQNRAEKTRRPFTLDELRRVVAVADLEWRAMIAAGLYSGGQRIGDVARWTWQHVDLAAGEIRFRTQKTDRQQIFPIVGPLREALLALEASDNPKAPVFPKAFAQLKRCKDGRAVGLSNEFRELLEQAGLVAVQTHERKGGGRGARRKGSELSFHSLRHTATSWMKQSGVSVAIVQDIVGHESAAISQHYTTIENTAKREALATLPDVISAQ